MSQEKTIAITRSKDDSEEFIEPSTSTDSLRISIIGRPNAGKSTLVNQLLGEERVLVSPESGTTRDSIEVPFKANSKEITLIDTAGMRRKRSIKEDTEKFSVSKSVESIKKANVVILLLDSSENIVDQDIHLLGLALTIGRPVIIAANKLDLLSKKLKDHGIVHITTDWENYAEHIMETLESHPHFKNCAGAHTYSLRPEYRPLTKFENRGQKLGHGVWDIIFTNIKGG